MNKTFSYKFNLEEGRVLTYSQLGSERGIPVLYIHGFPGSRFDLKTYFDDQYLTDNNINLISFDRPGLGASDNKSLRDVHDFSNDTCMLMEHLGIDKFHVITNSSGSLYAYDLAFNYPERLLSVNAVSAFLPNNNDMPHLYKSAFNISGLYSRISVVRMKLKLINTPIKYFRKHIEFMLDEEILGNSEIVEAMGKAHLVGFGNDMPGVMNEFKIINTYSGIRPELLDTHIDFYYSSKDLLFDLPKVQDKLQVFTNHSLNIIGERGHLGCMFDAKDVILNKIIGESL